MHIALNQHGGGILMIVSESNVLAAAEAVCDALRRHAEACDRAPDDSLEIVPAALRVGEAAASYADILKRQTGGGIVFERVKDDSLVDCESPGDGGTGRDEPLLEEVEFVVVYDKYFLRIDDPDAFMSFAKSRLGQDVAGPGEAARRVWEDGGWRAPEKPLDGCARMRDGGRTLILRN